MTIYRSRNEIKPGRVCLAMGMFDGVHLGHQQVIRQTLADARQTETEAVVITFDRHPNSIVAPDRTPPLIYSLSQKLQAIAALQVDALYLIHFDTAFSRQSGEEFVRALAHDFGSIQSVCVGRNFSFGHKRTGTIALLEQLGALLHFTVHGLAAVSLDEVPVSSTRIRDAIRRGHLDSASQMLGRPYSLAAPVLRGDRLGRQLGFPTANLDVAGLVLPPPGVYAAHVRLQGANHRAVLNVGLRPTVTRSAASLRLEVHILGFEGDLYGTEIEVVFARKLREERRFDSLDQLRDQIRRDVASADSVLSARLQGGCDSVEPR